MSSINTLKILYKEGYRCIYYEGNENCHKVYLKNFDSEHSLVVEVNDENQFSEFQNYIDTLPLS
ncbi:MAG: hypothetical protein R3Y64_08570 [Peptostreptococcaceae bacterium]